MSQSKFEINTPRSQLPPSTLKVITYSGSAISKDIYQTYRAMAISCKILNSHASNTITVSVDNEPTFTVPALSLVNLEDIQFTTLDIDGTGTGEVLIKIIPQKRLQTNKLIEVD